MKTKIHQQLCKIISYNHYGHVLLNDLHFVINSNENIYTFDKKYDSCFLNLDPKTNVLTNCFQPNRGHLWARVNKYENLSSLGPARKDYLKWEWKENEN